MIYTVPRGADILANAVIFYSELVSSLVDRLFPNVDPRILEANKLRRYADQVKSYSHSLASDLYAAADRHDRNI